MESNFASHDEIKILQYRNELVSDLQRRLRVMNGGSENDDLKEIIWFIRYRFFLKLDQGEFISKLELSWQN